MKIKNSLMLLALLVITSLSGQVILSVNSEKITDSGNIVSAIGSFEFNDGHISGWVQNTSTANASLVGFWLFGPDIFLESNLFTNEP